MLYCRFTPAEWTVVALGFRPEALCLVLSEDNLICPCEGVVCLFSNLVIHQGIRFCLEASTKAGLLQVSDRPLLQTVLLGSILSLFLVLYLPTEEI